MNTTPENVPDETLLQAKVVHVQLLIRTNTRDIVREIRQIHMIDLEIRTMQIGEFELLVQLDMEDHLTGQTLATFGYHRPTDDIITKLQQRIDTDIDTLYQNNARTSRKRSYCAFTATPCKGMDSICEHLPHCNVLNDIPNCSIMKYMRNGTFISTQDQLIQDCFGRNQNSQYRTLFQEQRHLKLEFKYH